MKNNIQLILDLVRDLPQLELTGSRYFNTATQSSDWDFMLDCEFEEKIPVDFVKVSEPSYDGDPLICGVYFSALRDTHIQLLNSYDMPLKRKAQEILYESGALCGVSKQQARRIWNAVIRALLVDTYTY